MGVSAIGLGSVGMSDIYGLWNRVGKYHSPKARSHIAVNVGAGLGLRGTGVIGSANVDNVRKWHSSGV